MIMSFGSLTENTSPKQFIELLEREIGIKCEILSTSNGMAIVKTDYESIDALELDFANMGVHWIRVNEGDDSFISANWMDFREFKRFAKYA